jgi:Tol biopolymer transport system component
MTARRLLTALATIVAVGWGAAGAAAAAPPALISYTPAGAAGNANSGTFGLAVSADGDAVAFSSMATDLGPAVVDMTPQVYVRRRSTGEIALASLGPGGAPGDALSTRPSISGDGQKVTFLSSATNLDPRDTDQRTDAYVTTVETRQVALVSTSSDGEKADAPTNGVTISTDGSTVAFVSAATNLDAGAGGAAAGVFVKDLATGAVTLASAPDDGATGDGEYGASGVSLSADGRRVAFSTDAALTAADDNGRADVYVKDLGTGELILASQTPDGVLGNAGTTDAVLHPDGSAVVFASFASNLDPRDSETDSDIYRRDLATGTLTLLSTTSDGRKADASSSLPSVSGDGRFVSFASYATNLDPRAVQGWQLDIYVKDTAGGDVRLASAGADGRRADGTSLYSALTGAGSEVIFTTNSTTLSARDTNRVADVYAFDPFPATVPPPPPPPPPPNGEPGHGHQGHHGRQCGRRHRHGDRHRHRHGGRCRPYDRDHRRGHAASRSRAPRL